jgi:hypothetical protein
MGTRERTLSGKSDPDTDFRRDAGGCRALFLSWTESTQTGISSTPDALINREGEILGFRRNL